MEKVKQNHSEITGYGVDCKLQRNIGLDNVAFDTTNTEIRHAQALINQTEFHKAYKIYAEMLNKNPVETDALIGIATILQKQQKYLLAIKCLSKAIEFNPTKTPAIMMRGRLFRLIGKFENAISDFTNVIGQHPSNVQAIVSRGITFGQTNQFTAAINDFSSSIKISPDCSEAFYNRGVVYEKLRLFESAIDDYSTAIEINPNDYKSFNNRGVLRRETRCFQDALKDFDKSTEINPEFAEGFYNKSLTLLSVGKVKEGFKLYEYRWKTPHFQSQVRNFFQPLWLGDEELTGKIILLHSEQGLGDSIQFCRYIKLFKNFDCKVLLEVEKPLVGLMECLLPRNQIFEKGATLPNFDYQCPLMSLALAFSTDKETVPFSKRYLFTDFKQVESWRSRLEHSTKPKVGICWRGNSQHCNDHKRSIPLSSIIDLLDENFAWVSLQYDADEIELDLMARNGNLTHFGSQIGDFAMTAALCKNLDAIICVDTSIAHLAGAIGKKVFLLLCDVPDGRWHSDAETTPWYLNTTLIRQKERFNWRPSVQRAKELVLSKI